MSSFRWSVLLDNNILKEVWVKVKEMEAAQGNVKEFHWELHVMYLGTLTPLTLGIKLV